MKFETIKYDGRVHPGLFLVPGKLIRDTLLSGGNEIFRAVGLDGLTFLDYPPVIRPMIYKTNIIERKMKEIKKRIKTMNSLPD